MNVTLPAQGWVPRHYQLPLLKYMQPNKPNLRAVAAWHRRAGKDLTSVNVMALKAFQRRGLYLYVGPFQNQIRRIIWQGQDKDGRKFIDFIPRDLVARKSEQEMSLTLTNGSVVQLLGADNPDKLVGINPLGIVFSEYSLCDPVAWQLTSPILNENGGWALFNGTPRGQNHFFKLLERAKADKEWYASHLSVTKTKAMTPDQLRKARNESTSEAKFQSEYMCSFHTPVEGAYYGEIMTRITKKGQVLDLLPPDPALPVHTAWDLGMDDATSIWFFQQHGKEIRIVNYFESSGEGLPFYVKHLGLWSTMNDVTFGKHYLPHDVNVRELGSGRSRKELLRSLGVRVTTVRRLGKGDQIEAVRAVLPRCWFGKKECSMGIEHLKGYRKEWDEQKQVFRKTPVHDKCSHGADAFATLAVGLKDTSRSASANVKDRTEYKVKELSW